MRRLAGILAAGAAVLAFAAAPAHAAKSCPEPRGAWERATPGEAGMDAAKLQAALDYGSSNAGFAVRVYRHGCLVGEDRLAPVNRNETSESYSMAKSLTSLLFGRAMSLRHISPDDPVGSLVIEAGYGHGVITARDLLTMTSGLDWNGFRDYNVFTMPDRVHDALTLDIVHWPGGYYEYAQSPVALLAEQVSRSVGEDPEQFLQRELLDALHIPADRWDWSRDKAGHIQGFYGVQMRPDDYGRLGELLRRGGVWGGRRLLSKRYLREALAPAKANGCYGWLIWLNAGAPCIGPRVSERPESKRREFPDLPADLYHFSGLFGQLVAVFPSQGIVVVRTGQDPGLASTSEDADWEHGLYSRVLGAVTDQRIEKPGEARPNGGGGRGNPDEGFQNSLTEPDRYKEGAVQEPLPPTGPPRARAAQLEFAPARVSAGGVVRVRVRCPVRWPSRMRPGCRGRLTLSGNRRQQRFHVSPGYSKLKTFRLTARRMRVLRRRGGTLILAARNFDHALGTIARERVTIKRLRSGR